MKFTKYLSELGLKACDAGDSLDHARHCAYLVREALERYERRGQIDGDAVRELQRIAGN